MEAWGCWCASDKSCCRLEILRFEALSSFLTASSSEPAIILSLGSAVILVLLKEKDRLYRTQHLRDDSFRAFTCCLPCCTASRAIRKMLVLACSLSV